MNKPFDIVIFALSRAKQDYSSPIMSLCEQFVKNHRVFFVNNPFTWKDALKIIAKGNIKEGVARFTGGEEKLENGIHVVTPKAVFPANFLGKKGFSIANKRNTKNVRKAIGDVIAKNKVDDYVYINAYNPFYIDVLPKRPQPLIKIYHCMDEISESKYIQKHGTEYEIELMKQTDFTVCTSTELQKEKGKTAREAFLLQNAANIELFGIPEIPHQVPADLSGQTQPKVLYVGNIDDRVDFEMLKEVIELRKDMTFVFVGPTSSHDKYLKEIIALDNTLFLGVKKLEDVPAYIHNVQCTIIPFKRNKLTKSIYPLKINEYLAAGKPVVSTGFSEDIKSFSDNIGISNDAEGFAEKLLSAVESDSEELVKKRLYKASFSSWEARANAFIKIMEDYLSR